MKNEKLKKRKKHDNQDDSPKNKPMLGKIGVDRNEELKNKWRGKRFRKLKSKKNWNKSKTVEQRKPIDSQVICEISPEGTSGLWRVGFMEKKSFEARMKKYRCDFDARTNYIVIMCCYVQ